MLFSRSKYRELIYYTNAKDLLAAIIWPKKRFGDLVANVPGGREIKKEGKYTYLLLEVEGVYRATFYYIASLAY